MHEAAADDALTRYLAAVAKLDREDSLRFEMAFRWKTPTSGMFHTFHGH